jgi:hypothetical protein
MDLDFILTHSSPKKICLELAVARWEKIIAYYFDLYPVSLDYFTLNRSQTVKNKLIIITVMEHSVALFEHLICTRYTVL